MAQQAQPAEESSVPSTSAERPRKRPRLTVIAEVAVIATMILTAAVVLIALWR